MFNNKIIHVFDDQKFIDATIKLFEEVVPNKSEYYIIKPLGQDFEFVKSKIAKKIDFFNKEEKLKFYNYLNSNNNILFLHALDTNKQDFTFNVNANIVKVWFVWGYDLYCNWPLFEKNIYLKYTKKYLNKKVSLSSKLKYNKLTLTLFKLNKYSNIWLPNLVSKKLDHIYNTTFYKAVKLIDIFVPVVPTEFRLVKKMGLKCKYAPFTYGCLEDLLGTKINESVYNKPNILVGNSADPSNNHLEIFYKLSKLNLGDRKIIVPLSYGGNNEYKKMIINKGVELFGDNFVPLDHFMKLEDYNKILLNCGTLIFNHVRQQGVGNIILLGYLGAKVYLNNKSPVYEFYKKEGILLYETNKISKHNFFNKMSPDEFSTNKKCFSKLYSRKNVHNKIIKLLEKVMEVSK